MNLDQIQDNIAQEVLMLLLHSDEEVQNKIPTDVVDKLTQLAASSNKDIDFKNKNVIDDEISKEALDIYSLLYYCYVADDNLKKELISNWKNNDSTNE
jgi:hypothetical protein